MFALISRAQSRAQGLTRYFTGCQCPRGHICERITSNSDCVKCANIRNGKRYKNNVEYRTRTLARWRINYENDPIKFIERSKQNYAKDPAPWKEKSRQWRINNQDKNSAIYKAKRARRRALEAGADGHHGQKDILDLKNAQKTCVCGAELSANYHLDHKIPLSRGGSNWPENLQLLCAPCNCSKGAKTMEEWRGRL